MTEHIVDNPEQHRYEIFVDEELVGFSAYRDANGVRDVRHTEVFEGWEGRGIGTRLLRGALELARTAGLRVRATCPMLAAYLEKHPEEQDLVA